MLTNISFEIMPYGVNFKFDVNGAEHTALLHTDLDDTYDDILSNNWGDEVKRNVSVLEQCFELCYNRVTLPPSLSGECQVCETVPMYDVVYNDVTGVYTCN